MSKSIFDWIRNKGSYVRCKRQSTIITLILLLPVGRSEKQSTARIMPDRWYLMYCGRTGEGRGCV